jgi:hypothetical protein
MTLLALSARKKFQPPVAQRHLKAEVAHCVGGVLGALLGNLHHAVPDRLLFLEPHDDLRELSIDRLPGLPVTAVVMPGRSVPTEWIESYEGDPPRVLLIPLRTPDPEREDRLLVDLRPPMASLAQFVEGARV